MKVEIAYFEMKKFFTPLKSFLPPFCLNEVMENSRFSISSLEHSDAKKGGKKLLGGVKNFSISKCGTSAFSWTKNYPFISKSHSCSFLEKEMTKNHLAGAVWGVSFKRQKFNKKQEKSENSMQNFELKKWILLFILFTFSFV